MAHKERAPASPGPCRLALSDSCGALLAAHADGSTCNTIIAAHWAWHRHRTRVLLQLHGDSSSLSLHIWFACFSRAATKCLLKVN